MSELIQIPADPAEIMLAPEGNGGMCAELGCRLSLRSDDDAVWVFHIEHPDYEVLRLSKELLDDESQDLTDAWQKWSRNLHLAHAMDGIETPPVLAPLEQPIIDREWTEGDAE